MKIQVLQSKLFTSGLLSILVGFFCLYYENTYYQYVDESGRLHESFFLPLGIFTIFLGVLFISVFCIKKGIKYFAKKHQ